MLDLEAKHFAPGVERPLETEPRARQVLYEDDEDRGRPPPNNQGTAVSGGGPRL